MTAFTYIDPLHPAAIRACLLAWRGEHPECGALALLPEKEAGRPYHLSLLM